MSCDERRAASLLATKLRDAGVVAFGVVRPAEVEPEEWKRFEEWLEKGWHAGMAYMENYPEIRRDPRKLLEGAKSLISMAFNYRQPNPVAGLATYALGEDYHKVLRKKLKGVVRELRDEIGGDWRICIDSAPILERYWAVKARVGMRSVLHGNVAVPGAGSMVFLAEILTTEELPIINGNFAGESKLSVSANMDEKRSVCPTGALKEGGIIDARRCINYLTIEKKDDLTEEEQIWTRGAKFGCDICQMADPQNQTKTLAVLPEFRPMKGIREFLTGEPTTFEIKKSPLSRKKWVQKGPKNH